MNAVNARATRIFGVPIGINPKMLLTGLVTLAGLLFWYNSRSDETPEGVSPTLRGPLKEAPVAVVKAHTRMRTPFANATERGTLRLRPVNPQNGDIDPTLRLEALARLASIDPPATLRNLFEISSPTAAPATGPVVIPTPVSPVVPVSVPAATPPVNIPLKYYGFVHLASNSAEQKGFFLDGDNILVAAEGDVLKAHYLVVALTPTSARMEDTQLKQGKVLPVSPEAFAQ